VLKSLFGFGTFLVKLVRKKAVGTKFFLLQLPSFFANHKMLDHVHIDERDRAKKEADDRYYVDLKKSANLKLINWHILVS